MTEVRIDEFFAKEKIAGVQVANYLKALSLHQETQRFHKDKKASGGKPKRPNEDSTTPYRPSIYKLNAKVKKEAQ